MPSNLLEERKRKREPSDTRAPRPKTTAASGGAAPNLSTILGSASAGGQTVPAVLNDKMEKALGRSFADVRVHEGPEAPSAGADAFAQRRNLYFAPGKYDPGSSAGQHDIAHELVHLGQQEDGRVAATSEAHGWAVNEDTALEREADEEATRALAGAAQAPASAAVRPASPPTASSGGAIQRLKSHAEKYIAANPALKGIKPCMEGILEYISDPKHDEKLARGLVDAWNSGQKSNYHIDYPPGADLMSLDYSSDESTEYDADDANELRRTHSDYNKTQFQSLGTPLDVEEYRKNTARVEFESDYKYTSSVNSNLIAGKGYTTSQSDYTNVINSVRGHTGSDHETAQLMLHGLFDFDQFQAAVKSYGEKGQNQAHFFLALLMNECLGRSGSNLFEVVAVLVKTVKLKDSGLRRRFMDRLLLTPRGKDHNEIGGQKLSRIGQGHLDESTLDAELTTLLSQNRQMVHSLALKLGCSDVDQLKAKLEPIYDAFIANVEANLKFDIS